MSPSRLFAALDALAPTCAPMAPVVLNGFVEAELVDARAVVAWWRERERAPSGRGGGGKGGCNVPLMVHAAARQLVEEFEAQGFGEGAGGEGAPP